MCDTLVASYRLHDNPEMMRFTIKKLTELKEWTSKLHGDVGIQALHTTPAWCRRAAEDGQGQVQLGAGPKGQNHLPKPL